MDKKPIGGYFEWEFPNLKEFTLHNNAVFVNSGKHALEYVLRGLGNVKKVYIPYFTCVDVVFPIERLNIPYNFYHINERLEIQDNINLNEGEYIIATNYYGIKDSYVRNLFLKYKERLIIDNAHALWCPAIKDCHQIYSPRKSIGMPDGGLVVSPIQKYEKTLPVDKSYDRCSQLLKRLELNPSEGYSDYKLNGKKNIDTPLSQMSAISRKILCSVGLDSIRNKRIKNFELLHNALGYMNELEIPPMNSFAAPLVYPFFIKDNNLRSKLIQNNIFVATYWPNVFDWCNENDIEYKLAKYIHPLPCDQRYGEEDMERIVKLIK